MRFFRSLLLALLLAAGVGLGQEIVKNPGFSEDADGNGLPDHWNVAHARVLWREKVFMGKDYELVSKPNNYVLATQDITLVKGQRYTITLRCKAEGGGLAGALIVHGATKPTREMPLVWRIEPDQGYEDVLRTFIAPNPVARLYIYNVARTKGVVYYDHVSIREGGPDRAIIPQLSFKKIDRPLTPPPERRHIDWASSLAGGPVKAFITLRNFRCLRQVVELMQRMDLDADVVHTGYVGDECASTTGRRATKRLAEGYYEVYVVPSRVSDVMAKTIRERVEAGAGLVVVEGFGRARRFVDAKQWRAVNDAHPLRTGIPWDLMPEKILDKVEVAALGKGRVARLVFPTSISRVWGLMPSENSRDAYRSRQFEYWEWWESLLAKAILWAARGESDARLDCVRSDAASIVVQTTHAPKAGKLRVVMRSGREIRFDGPIVRKEPFETPVAPEGRVMLPVPDDFPAGPVIADVMLLDQAGNVLTWGSYTTTKPQAVRVMELAADAAAVEPEGDVALTVTLAAERACRARVEGRLIDAFGRVVSIAAKHVDLSAGESGQRLVLAARRPLCVHHKASVRVMVDGMEHDRRWLTVLVPQVGPRRARQDFLAMPWGPGMSHPLLKGYYAELTQELGLNGEFGGNLYVTGEHGVPYGGYVGRMSGYYRESKYSESGVRRRCLSDPAVIKTIREQVLEAAREQQRHGPLAIGITDEAFLSSRHRRHELCFGEHCQARYREWLQKQYKTLAALNAQWGTQHASWDAVKGVRTEDVRGKDNLGPFVDFRTFMTDVWVEACKRVVDAYHEAAPHVAIGHTNTFGAGPFNGNDYWKLCTKAGFGWGQEYSEAIKGTGHKAIFDLWRSFVETPPARAARTPAGQPVRPFFNYGWIGYHHDAAAAQYEPWWLALHGARGVSYFATNAIAADRGASWALVFPTLSFTGFSHEVKAALADLRGGCGKVFLEYERERPQVAILWSHPSMLVSWCESQWDQPVPNERDGTDSYGTYFRSALGFRQHLNELQLDYSYVAPEQIMASDVLGQYRVVVLPFTVAASDGLIDRLCAYVEAGGVVVGDLRCLRTDAHGKPFADAGRTERLFGFKRGRTGVDYGATTVTFSAEAEGIGLPGQTAGLFAREDIGAAGATALAAHATGEPAVLVHRLGKGLSVYLNFAAPLHDLRVRELVRQVFRRAGGRRVVVAENPAGGDPPRCYERNTFSRGPITVHGFIRDHRRCEDSDPVRFDFGRESHVYDMRSRTYVGRVRTVETTLPPGHTALYACLSYRVTGATVSAPERVRAGMDLSVTARVESAEGQVGDHVLHVDVVGPDGRAPRHYARNVLAPRGAAKQTVPLALNEQLGSWQVRVRDVLTGATGQAGFVVEEAGGAGP